MLNIVKEQSLVIIYYIMVNFSTKRSTFDIGLIAL